MGILFLSGCGYHLRGTERPFFLDKKIKTLYLHPVQNNSFKEGVEISARNALRKRFAQGKYVTLVDDPKLADAEIFSAVLSAEYVPQAVNLASQLLTESPTGAPRENAPDNVTVASSYRADLRMNFTLKDRRNGAVLWGDQFSRGMSFQGTTFMGALGATSGLINESQFETVLQGLVDQIVTDAEEGMNSQF